ncbi:MAG: hypothetical protein DKINENOH_00758 [bacterium]|nr:hypothetical protein [bacterium]MCK6560441.1 PorT family protein [bacterium]NUM66675.1 PorT family protein [candidate division KSB1 bacterium]
MKRFGVMVALLSVLGLTIPASAQVQVGVMGGLNLAKLNVDPDMGLDISNRTAFGAGGVLQVGLAENLSLQLQPMYLQKGAKGEGEFSDPESGLSGKAETTAKAAFLEVPAMLKFNLSSGNTKPYIMAGPMIGFLLSNKQEIKITGSGFEDYSEEVDIKDETKSIDFGLGFGAGVSFPAGNNSLFVEGRYALGLTNLNDDPEDSETSIKTRGIQVMAGVTFPLGQ